MSLTESASLPKQRLEGWGGVIAYPSQCPETDLEGKQPWAALEKDGWNMRNGGIFL